MEHSIVTLLAVLTGFALGYFIRRKEHDRVDDQWENLFAYDGTKQEEV